MGKVQGNSYNLNFWGIFFPLNPPFIWGVSAPTARELVARWNLPFMDEYKFQMSSDQNPRWWHEPWNTALFMRDPYFMAYLKWSLYDVCFNIYTYIWAVTVLMPLKITQPNQMTTNNFSTSQLLQIPWDAALNPPKWRLSWDHPSGAMP